MEELLRPRARGRSAAAGRLESAHAECSTRHQPRDDPPVAFPGRRRDEDARSRSARVRDGTPHHARPAHGLRSTTEDRPWWAPCRSRLPDCPVRTGARCVCPSRTGPISSAPKSWRTVRAMRCIGKARELERARARGRGGGASAAGRRRRGNARGDGRTSRSMQERAAGAVSESGRQAPRAGCPTDRLALDNCCYREPNRRFAWFPSSTGPLVRPPGGDSR